jgi:hypothetical protein
MDLSKFKTSDWLKVGGGALFFSAGFMSWWKVDLGDLGSVGANGWDYFFTTGIAWLLLVAVAVITVLRVMNIKVPADLPWPLVMLAATLVSLLLVLIRFLSDGVGIDGSGLSRGTGAFLGMIGAIAALAGAVMGFKESGGDFNDLKDVNKLKAEFAKGGDDTPSPPPMPQ